MGLVLLLWVWSWLPGSGPASFIDGSGPAPYGSGPASCGSGPAPYGSDPASFIDGSGPAPYGSGPGPLGLVLAPLGLVLLTMGLVLAPLAPPLNPRSSAVFSPSRAAGPLLLDLCNPVIGACGSPYNPGPSRCVASVKQTLSSPEV